MKIRVAVVLPYFGNGGAENMVAHLVSHLDLSRVMVQVFCIYGKPQENHLENEVCSHGVKIVYIGKDLGFSLNAVLRLYRELSRFSPDIVHTHLMACMYTAPWISLHKVKMLHTLHSIPQAENNYKIREIITGFLYKTKKAIPVAISAENQKLIADYYKLGKESIEVIGNPVITKKYYHKNIYNKNGIVLITVGRLSKEKNQIMMIHVLAEVVKEYHNIRLIIVGDGKERGYLEQEAANLGVKKNIEFVGKVVDVENYLCNADIFLLSSLYEGVPLSILEAMAAGLPIVSTNVGGIKDIVTDNGVLVPPNDVNKMKEAIIELIQKPEFRQELGKRSLINVAKYDASNIAKEYTKLYQKYS